MQLPIVKGIAPFSVGCTSCVYPDTAVENVKRVAHAVDDMELMFFENPSDGNFPTDAEFNTINDVFRHYNTSCTVHLPTENIDDFLAGQIHLYAEPAIEVIRKCSILSPRVYVLHVGKDSISFSEEEFSFWIDRVNALIVLLSKVGIATCDISIENLYYPMKYNDSVVKNSSCKHALDIGHLWASGVSNWEEILLNSISDTAVIHLHGYEKRDHASLTFAEKKKLVRLCKLLLETRFSGVLTCEVFGEKNTISSLQIMKELWEK